MTPTSDPLQRTDDAVFTSDLLELYIALADDRLNKRGDPIACHIYLVNALAREPLSEALQDEARALLDARRVSR